METKTFTLQMQENAEYIFERYKGLIYKIARDILDDSLLAEDCLQEVVLKLALLPGKLNTDEYEYPDAFVAIVARNQALDMLKSKSGNCRRKMLNFKNYQILQRSAKRIDISWKKMGSQRK